MIESRSEEDGSVNQVPPGTTAEVKTVGSFQGHTISGPVDIRFDSSVTIKGWAIFSLIFMTAPCPVLRGTRLVDEGRKAR